MNHLKTGLLLGATLIATTFHTIPVSSQTSPKPVDSTQLIQAEFQPQQSSVEPILEEAFNLLDANKPTNDDAIAAVEQALSLNPNHAEAQDLLEQLTA